MSKVTPLSAEQINQLAAMQDHLNQLTCQTNFGHTDWRSMGFNWGLAIVDEVMEIHGHLGWKWWKGSQKYNIGVTEENKKQVQLEVIDILHFGLSKWMQEADPKPLLVSTINSWDMRDCLEELVSNAQYTYFCWDTWATLCVNLDLDATQIMETYIGKYALNIFRQDNGYGDGTYDKYWYMEDTLEAEGVEDNQYLEHVIQRLKDKNIEVTVENVTEGLTDWYDARVK